MSHRVEWISASDESSVSHSSSSFRNRSIKKQKRKREINGTKKLKLNETKRNNKWMKLKSWKHQEYFLKQVLRPVSIEMVRKYLYRYRKCGINSIGFQPSKLSSAYKFLSRTISSYHQESQFRSMISLISEAFQIKWGASSRWSFGPNSVWGSVETMTIGKTHPNLIPLFIVSLKFEAF